MRETMLILHFIGLAMGLGTSFGFMFLGIAASKMPPEEGKKFTLNAMSLSKMGHVGLTLLVITGIYLIIPYWSNISEMPLLITKLVLVVVLGALIGIISSKARKAKEGNEAELAKIRPLGMMSMLTAIVIVALAVLVFH